MTQMAIPYAGGSIWFRSRYSGSWDTWARVLDSRSAWKMGSTTVVDTSRNLTNIGTASLSGAITAQGYKDGTTTIIDSSGSIGVKNTSSSSGKGISLYNGAYSGQPTYGIMFAGRSTFGSHGGVTGSWATYFTMSNNSDRGWIFKRGTTNVASISGNGDAVFNGNVTAYSDITLKDNINNIENALDKVNSIRGVTYDRIDQDNARHTGVIAQEVEQVLPEVVHTDDDGIKSVAYGNMVGLLIEAIKELKNEIEELKNGNN